MSRTAHKLMASGAKAAYEIDQSLVLEDGDTAYLTRKMPTQGNLRTWTASCWVKRTSLGYNESNLEIIYCSDSGGSGSGNYSIIYFDSSDRLGFYHGSTTLALTTRVFRDVSSWYHIYIKLDTTQGTASDRWAIYVNGVQETSFGQSTNPGQNDELAFNNGHAHYIGRYSGGGYFDGCISEFHNLDGTVKPVTDFGETDSDTGQWIAKETAFTTAEYGTNGFYLKFAGETAKYSPYFDTDVQGIYLAHTNAIDSLGTKNFTTEGWIYPEHDGASGSYDCIWSCGVSQQIYWNKESEMVRVFYQDGSSYIFNNVTSTANVKQGEWCHFAVVRNGTSMTIYTHGVGGTAATSSGSITASSTNAYIGTYQGESGGSQFWGSVYGLRHTIGTARYTSNFTPPTADLTDDIAWNSSSNTGVGFLQVTNSNSTITDAGEGHTITKVGSWSSRYFSPTVTDVGNDSSGKGNDFIPGNLLPSDVVLDSPTNNYCVVNRRDSSLNLKTIQGNLKFNSSNTDRVCVRGTMGVTSGKWYFEYTDGASGSGSVGVATAGATSLVQNGMVGNSSQGWAVNNDGAKENGNSETAGYMASFTTGDVVSVALNMDDGEITFYKNGSSAGVAFTNLGSKGAIYPAICTGSHSSNFDTLNFGQVDFAHTPPSGYKAWNSDNLPVPTIKNPTEHFNTVLWSGNESQNRAITGVGFAPDLVWIKSRSNTYYHQWHDRVRGTSAGVLYSNRTDAEDSTYGLASFNSDGFTVMKDANNDAQNDNGINYVAWNWKAGGSGSSNTDGAQTTTVSANQTSGFSIVTGTGTGSATTYGHGLGVEPKVIITKARSATDDWYFFTSAIDGIPYNTWQYNKLNTTNAFASDSATADNTTTFTTTFTNGTTFVAYCFADVPGFSQFGIYEGSGSSNGPHKNLNFKPAWLMIKKISAGSGSWWLYDNKRNLHNVASTLMWADTTNADTTDNSYRIDMLSNGFKIRDTNTNYNASGVIYFYMAFAEAPFKYANAR